MITLKNTEFLGYIFSCLFFFTLYMVGSNIYFLYVYQTIYNILLVALSIGLSTLMAAILHIELKFAYQWKIFKFLNPIIKLTERVNPVSHFYTIVISIACLREAFLGDWTGFCTLLALMTLLIKTTPVVVVIKTEEESKEESVEVEDKSESVVEENEKTTEEDIET